MSKVILITGASTGIGRTTAEYLTKLGHRVYGTSRKPFNEVVSFQTVVMDVTDDTSVQNAIAHVLQREQQIDILINNAGLGIIGALEEVPEEMIQRVFDTNVWGLLRVCRAVLPAMRQRRSGLIINVGSIAGRMGLPFRGIYSASKASVEILTETLSIELKPFGIEACSVLPGDVRTNINANRLVAHSSSNSPYRAYVDDMNAKVNAEVSEAAEPMYIAKTIEKVINAKSPNIYYVAGPFLQRASLLLKRFLPSRVFEYLLRENYGMK
ncbi:SDR family oxidoreductase [Runella limosa]|uniref:SDR family oxidoreductase n=1 Tax=Runella limosa TaxID=370978 RepID=UPI000402F6A3|nr:SDR family oxidoreductase [Runella limosa]